MAVPSVLIVADLSVLAGDVEARGVAELLLAGTRGPVQVTRQALETQLCAGTYQLVVRDGREVIAISPRSRRGSAGLRAMVVARDGHCRFPGCTTAPALCVTHHIIWVSRGGKTVYENLLLLCDQHHHAIHDGHWTISGDPDGIVTFARAERTADSPPRRDRHATRISPPPPRRPHRRRSAGAPPPPPVITGNSDDATTSSSDDSSGSARGSPPDPLPF